MIRQFAGLMLVAVLIGAVFAFRLNSGPVAHAVGNGNAGDTKISQFPYPEHGLRGNDPHVPCGFYILGFNFQVARGTITIKSWPPTGRGSVVLTDTFTGSAVASGNFQFVNGPYSLSPGHYKSYVTDNKGVEISKQKVFWVNGPCATATDTATPTATATATDTATATLTATDTATPADTATSTATPADTATATATSTKTTCSTRCGPVPIMAVSNQSMNLAPTH